MKLISPSLVVISMMLVAACGNSQATAEQMIPARTLHCTLGHALNLDPSKDQTMADIQYEGAHSFSLFLPETKARQAPAPDATDTAEPVDPATRIIADPSGLRRDVPAGFARVVDLWPERVEMTQVISAPLVHFIVINQINENVGTANLFMTTATDIAAMNLKTVYQGPCKIIKGSDAQSQTR
jgi:hypothetical protein